MADNKNTKRVTKIKYSNGKKVKVKKKTGITKIVTPKNYAGTKSKRTVTKTKTGSEPKGVTFLMKKKKKK
jgi:hypothetical protein